MKRFILITIMFLFAWNNISNAQNGIKIVEAFANDMQMWIKTDDISYREKLEEICVGGCCVDDELSRLIIKESHLDSSDLMISSYLNKVQSHIANIKISYSNFEAVTNSVELARMNSKHEVEFIACDVLIEGHQSFYERNLHCAQWEDNMDLLHKSKRLQRMEESKIKKYN